MADLNKYIVKSNVVYELHNDGMFRGYCPVMPRVIEMDPYMSYIGPKIPMDLWREVLAFFKWAYDTTKSEVQVRLYFNRNTKAWKAWAFPQEKSTGMTTREIPDLCDKECAKMKLFSKEGWIEGGTIHSHCAMSAFQSGTDRKNEETKNGIHLTVGKLDEVRYDVDGRSCFRGQFYQCAYSQWFSLPEGLASLPHKFVDDVMKYFLTDPIGEDETFPEEWKDNVIESKLTGPGWFQATGGKNWPQGVGPQTQRGGPPYLGVGGGNGSRPSGVVIRVTQEGMDKLSKKEAKNLKHIMQKIGRDHSETGSWSDEGKLESMAKELIQIAATNGLEVKHMLRCGIRRPDRLTPPEEKAAKEMEEAIGKSGLTLEEVDDWITTTRVVSV